MEFFINQQLNRYQVSLPQRTREDFLVPLYYSVESCFPARIFNHAGHRRDRGFDGEWDKQSDLIVEALVPRACRQAVGTTASTTNGTKDRRRECGLWVFNLRPSLNLWIARINLFRLRPRRAVWICVICG